MHPLVGFYKRTGWLWLLFVGIFIVLGLKVACVFFILIPGLLAYSVYFGMIRASELAEAETLADRAFEVKPVPKSDDETNV